MPTWERSVWRGMRAMEIPESLRDRIALFRDGGIAYQDGADLFRVTFDNQVTEWLIGFDAEDKIALLLFRPAES